MVIWFLFRTKILFKSMSVCFQWDRKNNKLNTYQNIVAFVTGNARAGNGDIVTTLVLQGFIMMTSSNGNIFSVTGHLCVEFTGPMTRSFDLFFDLRQNKQFSKEW